MFYLLYIELIVGFPYDVMTFEASAVGNVIMILFGEARQGFVVNFIQGIYLYMCTIEHLGGASLLC